MDNLDCRSPLPVAPVLMQRLTHEEAIAFLIALTEKVDNVLDDWDCNDADLGDFASALIEHASLADLHNARVQLDKALNPGSLLP